MSGAGLSRKLRRGQTEAELKLWRYLRNRQVLGCKFRRQVQVDRFVADFLCHEAQLIIELDGSQHGEQQGYDLERTQILETAGFRVLRFWNNDVLSNTEAVLESIRETLILSGERDRDGDV